MEATTGTNGSATLIGGVSADKLIGGSGSDTMDGGAGSDLLNAGSGDDLLRYKLSDITATVAQDIYIGGSGKDTLEVVLTAEQWAIAEVRTQLFNYLQHLKNVTNSTTGEVSSAKASDFKFTFYGSTLTVQMVERLKVVTKEGVVLLDSTKEAVASGVALSGADVTGKEDASISLSGISAQLIDNDGSETMTLYVEGVPAGARLTSDGKILQPTTISGKTVYQLTAAELQKLEITPPANSDEDFQLKFTAFSKESNGGLQSAMSTLTVSVEVKAVADAPELTVTDVSGNEDDAISLGQITASLVDAGETLSVYITDVPAGAVLKAGSTVLTAVEGKYAVALSQLSNLTITPPKDSDADITLKVTAVSTEPSNGDAASTVRSLVVEVKAVADAPTLSVLPASGSEDTAIDIGSRISASLTDPSETLSISISGIPTGATLTSGSSSIAVTGGTAVVTAAQLAGLKITPPLNSDADFSLGVTALSTEPGVATPAASATQSLAVTVTAVADKPTLSVSDASGTANTPIVIGSLINAALTDTDGSESLSITLTGIPTGATLTNTAKDILTVSGGSITLSAQQLAGLAITPSNDVDFSLGVTAVSSEKNDLSTATSNTLAMNVVVNPAFTTDGNTSYQIAPNGGSLLINDTGGGQDTLTVSTSAGTVFSLLNFERVGSNLVLSMSAGGGSATVTIQNHFTSSPVELLQFSNGGSVYGYALGTAVYKMASDLSGTGNEDVIASSSLAESPSGGNGNDLVFGNGGADSLSGSNGNDLLVGGDGNDRLDGGDNNDVLVGGTGNDVLIGGLGNDVFVFGEFGASNADTIQGFDANSADLIRLSASVFAGVSGPGTLSSADFAAVSGTGTTANVNAGVNIIYDSSSGALYYDPNGGDGGGRVLFATLVGVSGTFDQSDIIVG